LQGVLLSRLFFPFIEYQGVTKTLYSVLQVHRHVSLSQMLSPAVMLMTSDSGKESIFEGQTLPGACHSFILCSKKGCSGKQCYIYYITESTNDSMGSVPMILEFPAKLDLYVRELTYLSCVLCYITIDHSSINLVKARKRKESQQCCDSKRGCSGHSNSSKRSPLKTLGIVKQHSSWDCKSGRSTYKSEALKICCH
jgi:hypothetical protein